MKFEVETAKVMKLIGKKEVEFIEFYFDENRKLFGTIKKEGKINTELKVKSGEQYTIRITKTETDFKELVEEMHAKDFIVISSKLWKFFTETIKEMKELNDELFSQYKKFREAELEKEEGLNVREN